MTRGLMIGAPRSGAGKTTVTLGLLAALRRRGVNARGAKSGPDYIDPAFHEAATGMASLNLDSWAMDPALLDATARAAGDGADLLVVESAMGLFDGAGERPGRTGAAADLAARFGLPVILVLDVSGHSQSAGAVARGFATHGERVHVAGAILNRVASERHRAGAAGAVEAAGVPVLGVLPRGGVPDLPERHLGLVQAREQGNLPGVIATLADAIEAGCDVERIAGAAATFAPPPGDDAPALPPPGQRIALAHDDAFTFIYPHLVAGWRRAGAQIVTFSPLAGEAPPEHCDACWLPGGYPELHAGRLAAARGFMEGIAGFSRTRPVHGECGGYMVLGRELEDAAGTTHAMAGLLDHATSFARRKMNLGYRRARLLSDCVLGEAGRAVAGHEFHYARVSRAGGDDALCDLSDGTGRALGPAGGRRGLVSGSFFHAIARAE